MQHSPSLVKLYAVLCTHCGFSLVSRMQLFRQALGNTHIDMEVTEEGLQETLSCWALGWGAKLLVARMPVHLRLSQLTQES